jgi:SAM-dependent methyltransferase
MYYKHNIAQSDVLRGAFDRIIYYQQHGNYEQRNINKGMYPFIPMCTDRLSKDFISLKNAITTNPLWSGFLSSSTTKFLDAGCGCGNVLLIARAASLTDKYNGIEFDKDNVEKANRMFVNNKENTFKIINGDILQFDKYHEYDIIYFYRPFSNSKSQILFERKVRDEMKVGAILLPYYLEDVTINIDKRFKKLFITSECAFIKISKYAENKVSPETTSVSISIRSEIQKIKTRGEIKFIR